MNAYQPPSVIAPYKGVAMVFAILLVALAVYFIKSLRPAHHPSPPPAQSVYVEVVPASAASASP